MSPDSHKIMYMCLTFIFWMSYCVFEGIREAYYYHSTALTSLNRSHNLHGLFTLQRFIVLLLCFFACGAKFSSMIEMFGLVYLFPYLHDGAYYCKRNDLNSLVYSKRWKDDSSTSTAKFEIKYKARLFMFLGGLLIFLSNITLTIFKIFI